MDRFPVDPVTALPRQAAAKEPPVFLTGPVTSQIEEALRRVGDFGEVRLVVVKGHLRFIQVTCSEHVQEP